MINLNLDKQKLQRAQRFIQDDRVQNYLNITLTIATLSIFVAFAIRPSIQIAIKLNQDLKEYEKIDALLSEKLINLSAAKSLQDELFTEIIKLDKTIPKESLESNILKNLNYVTIKNNVQLNNINYTYNELANYNEVEMDISISGTYESILPLLTDIHNLLRIIVIEDLDLQIQKRARDNLASEEIFLDGIIHAKAYYEKRKQSTESGTTNIDNQTNRNSPVNQ